MDGFWPEGLDLSDTEPPTAILETARGEWEISSDGLLTLVLQEATSKSGNSIIIVHAKHIPGNRTATLFSVVHRPDAPYPATIQPENEYLPDFLKKSYSQPGLGEIASFKMHGQEVENKWVSDTPPEFRSRLEEVFNLGSVKRAVMSLVSHSPRPCPEFCGNAKWRSLRVLTTPRQTAQRTGGLRHVERYHTRRCHCIPS